MTPWLLTVAGAVVVALALRDVSRTLFHPGTGGELSRWVMPALWTSLGNLGPKARSAVGPLGLLAVILTWTTAVAFGFALVYVAWLPESYVVSDDLAPETQGGLADALYVSLTVQATLGFGDITPVEDPLRFASVTQALIGFGLVSAAISWFLAVTPVVQRMRAFTHWTSVLRNVPSESAGSTAELDDLAREVVEVRTSLEQYPQAFYFHSRDRRHSLGRATRWLDLRAERGESAVLRSVLDDLLETLRGPELLDRPEASAEETITLLERRGAEG